MLSIDSLVRNSFCLILILSFLISGELISIPKFFESSIYIFYLISILGRV